MPTHRQPKVQRGSFKSLPNGAVYYLDSDGSGPNIKAGHRLKLATNTMPNGGSKTAIADVSVRTKRVGALFLGQSVSK